MQLYCCQCLSFDLRGFSDDPARSRVDMGCDVTGDRLERGDHQENHDQYPEDNPESEDDQHSSLCWVQRLIRCVSGLVICPLPFFSYVSYSGSQPPSKGWMTIRIRNQMTGR